MNFADTLRKELNDKNRNIISTEFEPRKETIMETKRTTQTKNALTTKLGLLS